MTDRARAREGSPEGRVERLPLPVARAFANLLRAAEPKERHDRAFAVFEVLLKYVAAAGIAAYVAGSERDHRANAALQGLARPSLGEWVGFLRQLERVGVRGLAPLRERTSEPALLELHRALLRTVEGRESRRSSVAPLGLLEGLVRYRNWGAGHGAPLAPERYEELARALTGGLEALLDRLDDLAALPLVQLGPDGGALDPARGPGAPPGWSEGGRLAIGTSGDSPPIRPLPLHPLLLWRGGDAWLLNGGLDARTLRVEYLSYASGEHLVAEDLEADHRRLLAVILGRDIERSEYGRIASRVEKDRASIPSVGPDEEPRRLGDYVLGPEIGRGGMGIVHEAWQRSIGRRVAVKRLRPGSDPRAAARFAREARSAARLHHPNIAAIYEVGSTAEEHYFSMELIEGPSLGEQIERWQKEGATGERDLAAWVERLRDVARGLHHAHEEGLVHRDVKPSNLMLAPGGRLVLVDFGLVQDEAEVGLTTSGERLGTLPYMSPEQIQREPVDRRSDVWSLGATLYELLTLRAPFDGANEVEIAKGIAGRDPAPPRSLRRDVHRDLDTIVLTALEKRPERRYATAGELADDLDRFLRHEPILARPAGPVRRVEKALRRHPILVAALLVAVITAVGRDAVRRAHEAAARAELLAAAREAIASGDPHAARDEVDLLRVVYGLEGEVREVAGDLGRALEARGEEHLATLGALEAERDRSEAERQRAFDARPPWHPVWVRGEELRAHDRYLGAVRGIDERYDDAVRVLLDAIEVTQGLPAAHEGARRRLSALYWERYREASIEGSVPLRPGYFEALLLSLGVDEYRERLRADARVRIASRPPGAEVFLFRFVTREARLVPLPCDPERASDAREDPEGGLVGGPVLRVDAVIPRAGRRMPPLAPGDRVVMVNDREVGLPSDFARALEPVEVGAAVELRVRRVGSEVEEVASWVPFPTSPPDERSPRVWNLREVLGVTFEAQPLEFAAEARVGTTREATPLEVALPRGSYLLVLRREGFVDARLPIAIRSPDPVDLGAVSLWRPEEVPPGFVTIPAGTYPVGGDREAEQPLPARSVEIGDLFIGRLEVTHREWSEFLAARAAAGTPAGAIRSVAPKYEDGELLNRPAGEPVSGISCRAAEAYAAWRTEQAGGRWRFRLPTDEEWETAARGADGRTFAWGDYLVWPWCLGAYWTDEELKVRPVGSFPVDESVFGVRDLTGSVREMTSGRPDPAARYRSVRAGYWNSTDARYFRLATRNARLPESSHPDTGFRLVAEPGGE